MSFEDHSYHVERAQRCRELAAAATDPDVRRRHEELAELHASRASLFNIQPGTGPASLTA